MMGINRVTKRGKARIEVRKRWPDGTTYRRYFPNMTLAKNVSAQIEAAIALGTWQEVRGELCGNQDGGQPALTVQGFSEVFLEQHCKVRMRSWKRYELSFKTLNPMLGGIPLKDFRRHHLHGYVQKRSRQVKPNSVNRDIACIKKMFSYALEVGAVDTHPLVRFPLLPVQEKAFKVMTLAEFRALVGAMERPSIAAMVAVMGETGIRKGEALRLEWKHLDLRQRILTVEHTKSRKVREVPLSEFALEWLSRAVRHLRCPFVFVNSRTGRRWDNPEKPFREGRKRAGLQWVGFHDLRRYRATQWVRHGVDLRTVQQLLGHADIQTTMKYARFVKSALQEVRQAQQAEAQKALEAWETNGRQVGSK